MAVRFMRAGAAGFIEKPVSEGKFLESVRRAHEELEQSASKSETASAAARACLALLAGRERQMLRAPCRGLADDRL